MSFFLEEEEAAFLDGVAVGVVGATLKVSTGLRALPLLRVGSGGGGGGGGLVRSRVVTMMMMVGDGIGSRSTDGGIACNVQQDSIQDTDTSCYRSLGWPNLDLPQRSMKPRRDAMIGYYRSPPANPDLSKSLDPTD